MPKKKQGSDDSTSVRATRSSSRFALFADKDDDFPALTSGNNVTLLGQSAKPGEVSDKLAAGTKVRPETGKAIEIAYDEFPALCSVIPSKRAGKSVSPLPELTTNAYHFCARVEQHRNQKPSRTCLSSQVCLCSCGK